MTSIRLSAMARADIANLLEQSLDRFGTAAQRRYERLLSAALKALLSDPDRPGAIERPELGDGVRSFHLRHVRRRSAVTRPRHLILYRIGADGVLEVGRVLHDAMELERHAAFDFPPEP